jgi:actin-related protein
MEKILRFTIVDELRVRPEEGPVLLTEPALNPRENRERTVELMFEQLSVPATFLAMQALLATYSSGRCTALTLDSGHGVTHIVPVYEGHTFFQAIRRVDVGGQDVTDSLASLLQQRGLHFASTADQEIVREIKERHCFVSEKPASDLADAQSGKLDKTFTLPDGQEILIGQERMQCTELLFHSKAPEMQRNSLQHLVVDSLMSCGVDTRKDFLSNIVLSGGNTMLPGIVDRLRTEIQGLIPWAERVRLIAAPERKLSVWIGGSILASLTTFQQHWISRQEYDEAGPGIVHRKCTI